MTDQAPDPLSPKPEQYFRSDTRFMRTLRFFNLLEPGRAVLSVSKLMMWAMFAVLVYTLGWHRENMIAVIGAVSGFTGTVGNYAWRRYMAAQPGGYR